VIHIKNSTLAPASPAAEQCGADCLAVLISMITRFILAYIISFSVDIIVHAFMMRTQGAAYRRLRLRRRPAEVMDLPGSVGSLIAFLIFCALVGLFLVELSSITVKTRVFL